MGNNSIVHINFIKEESTKIEKKVKSVDTNSILEKYSNPLTVYNLLKKQVGTQSEALKVFALIAAQRDAAMLAKSKGDKVKGSKLIVSGDSGVGKSYIAHALAEVTESALVRIDISQYTSSGYKGEDTLDIFKKHIPNAVRAHQKKTNNATLASRVVLFIDEIDKISSSTQSKADHQHAVMNELLVAMDEYESAVDLKSDGIDMTNIIWIFGGSFSTYRASKVKELSKGGIGFDSKLTEKNSQLNYKMNLKDYQDAGLTKEFMGRIGHCTTLDPVSDKMLTDLLNAESEHLNPLFSVIKLAENMGVEFKIDAKVKAHVVKEAMKKNLGVRGLRLAAEELLQKEIFKGM